MIQFSRVYIRVRFTRWSKLVNGTFTTTCADMNIQSFSMVKIFLREHIQIRMNLKLTVESHWLTCYCSDQSLFLVQSVLQLVSMLSMPPLPFLKYKFVLELSWKQVSKDRVWRDLIIESRSENDFRLHKKIFGWWFWVKNYFESSSVLKWSIILVRIFCRRTWRFGTWWSWIWGSGKWNRICKAYQFINRSSTY